MKLLLFVMIFLLSNNTLFAQIKNDFIVKEIGYRPASCISDSGTLYVIWDEFGVTWGDSEPAISYKKYDSLGTEIALRYLQNTKTGKNARQAVVGDYIVTAWKDNIDLQVFYGYFNIRGNIFNQLYDSFSINYIFHGYWESGGDSPRYNPDVYFLDDTTYFAIWYGLGGQFVGPGVYDITQPGVYGRIGTISGWPFGKEDWPEHTDSLSLVISDYGTATFNDVTHSSPRVVSKNESPFFSVAWQDDHTGNARLYSRIFYKDGTPKDSSFVINEDTTLINLYYLSMAMAPNGDYVIVWSADKDGVTSIYWKWYSNDGTAIANSELVTSISDEVFISSFIDIAIGKEGKMVVVWDGKLNNKPILFAKRFDENRNPIGESFKVSTRSEISSSQIYPNTEIRNNRIYFVWQESGQIWGNILDFDNPVSINDSGYNIPTKYTLNQNYPNPFNASTTISFSIPQKEHVLINLFDINGKKVKTLLNEKRNPGSYKLTFTLNDISSGVYLYNIKAGKTSATKKLILLK